MRLVRETGRNPEVAMFSSVGRSSRPARGRLAPLLLSLLLNGGTIGALVLFGARKVEEVVAAEVGVERPFELRVPEASSGGAAPAPRPEVKHKAVIRREVPLPTVPTPMPPIDATITTLAAEPSDGVTDAGAGPGDGEGDGNGKGPGKGDGEGDGLGNGDGIRNVHWSEVAVKTRAVVHPSDYPAAAQALNLPDTRCVVRIQIDEGGRPESVVVKTCPEVFRAAADSVARRYRFHPLLDDQGRPVKASFELALNFSR